jgi:hypothetical protein
MYELLHKEYEIIKLQESLKRDLNKNEQKDKFDEFIQEDSDNCTIDSKYNDTLRRRTR